MKRIYYIILFFSISLNLLPQQIPVRFLRNYQKIILESLNLDLSKDSVIFVSVLPVYYSDLSQIKNLKTLHSPSFIVFKNKNSKYSLNINPTIDLFAKYHSLEPFAFNPTIGLAVDFSLTEKLGISSFSYYYKNEYPFQTPILFPNFWPPMDFSDDHIYKRFPIINDFHIVYSPFDFLKIDFANSRNFIGNGYRSLLLSDIAKPYPNLKIQAKFLNFQYNILWARMISEYWLPFSITETQNKHAVFQYLEWRIHKRFSLGFFESVISSRKDFFNLEYLQPLIFLRPVEFNLGSEDNTLLGLNGRIIPKNKNIIYFQILIDDLIVAQLINDIRHRINPEYSGQYGWFANKWGIQLGTKRYDIFNLKNTDFFIEYNIVRPYTYSHSNVQKNYSHSSIPLAHPFGANFSEFITGVSYNGERFFTDIKYIHVIAGADSLFSHYGNNIFLPTMDGPNNHGFIVNSYGNIIHQGIRTVRHSAYIELGYHPFSSNNHCISLIFSYDHFIPENYNQLKSFNLLIGIRSNFIKFNIP
ncbi:MAG: hypothetical protein WHW07_02605 [Bacteroidales bacterium]|jgi:hypothetical protein|nr:hypothetical protein [Bacteroidales bacterium]HOL98513.1 hypothetical protein [Bacteroidales bacterium]HOM35672.1 hypothetical protein [Bacteroidales bacterium]HPD23189.1 hypothetical protein [Bacteroidales bacterium]HRS99118.1 hypothetical protein [Bacteroidales bacterium]